MTAYPSCSAMRESGSAMWTAPTTKSRSGGFTGFTKTGPSAVSTVNASSVAIARSAAS